jgi:hypothetical protein
MRSTPPLAWSLRIGKPMTLRGCWLAVFAIPLLACGGRSVGLSHRDASTSETPDAATSDAASSDSGSQDAAASSDSGTQDAAQDASEVDADADADTNEACDAGTIEFVLAQPPDSSTMFCPAGCAGSGWFSIAPGDGGETLELYPPCGTSCSSCVPEPCPSIPCISPVPLGDAGVSFTWDGTYTVGDHCGAPSRDCQRRACVPAGSYVMTMCASQAAPTTSPTTPTCSPSISSTCTSVPFVWPPSGSTVVIGEVKPDGG